MGGRSAVTALRVRGLAVVLAGALSPRWGGCSVAIHSLALAASHSAGVAAAARNHSCSERDCDGRRPLVDQSCGCCLAGVPTRPVGVDGGAHRLGTAGASGSEARLAAL